MFSSEDNGEVVHDVDRKKDVLLGVVGKFSPAAVAFFVGTL